MFVEKKQKEVYIMNLTKLQRNLYKELEQVTNVEEFNNGYKELIKPLTIAQRTYYPRDLVFEQGYVKGTPSALSYTKILEMIKKAGYKQVTADRTWFSYNKVMDVLYSNVF